MATIRLIIALAVAVLATHATARGKAELHCQEERGKTNCIDVANVRVNGDTRAAPMFTRGAKEDTAAPYTLVANCSKSVIILQDHHGAKSTAGYPRRQQHRGRSTMRYAQRRGHGLTRSYEALESTAERRVPRRAPAFA